MVDATSEKRKMNILAIAGGVISIVTGIAIAYYLTRNAGAKTNNKWCEKLGKFVPETEWTSEKCSFSGGGGGGSGEIKPPTDLKVTQPDIFSTVRRITWKPPILSNVNAYDIYYFDASRTKYQKIARVPWSVTEYSYNFPVGNFIVGIVSIGSDGAISEPIEIPIYVEIPPARPP